MPQSTDSQLVKSLKKVSELRRLIPASLEKSFKKVSGLRRFMPASAAPRPKVFFDSPGFLEQSQHWGGLIIWTIAVGSTSTLVWAFLGRVDQTVMANGTLQPVSGKMTVISPAGGIVRELFVSEGEVVAKGESLLVVESEGTKARLQSTQKQLALVRYENQLFNLLLDQSGLFDLNTLPEPPVLIRSEDRTRSVQLTVQETSARLGLLRTRLLSQRRTLALKKELVNSLKSVYENGGIAKFNYLDSVDELQRLESQIAETSQQLTATTGQAARQVSTNSRQVLGLEAQLVGLQEQQRNLTLKAQQPGEVFNLSVGPGSVIGRGAEVMRIVPDGGGLKAKVFLPNGELGFIKDGMSVKLAVSSFPPGEYGYLKGTVKNIGADALEGSDQQSADRQRANTFPMTIEFTDNQDKAAILDRLAPGMQVSANIIVRQRPIISLLTDVFTKGSESLQNSR
jgi:HlyD family secretion protein